jgi:ABC-type Fe3+ transport system permease subunit
VGGREGGGREKASPNFWRELVNTLTYAVLATAGIPPNATLCFEIEILSIREGKAT